MKFFNCLIVALVFNLIIACEKDNLKIDIRGDWFRYNLLSNRIDSTDNNQFSYEYIEMFVTDSIIFSYYNLLGEANPFQYYIKKDSFFHGFGINPPSEVDYQGKIKLFSNNRLIFYENFDTTYYYRLTNSSELLSDYIININSDYPNLNDSTHSFAKAFQKRSSDYHLKNK